ncbi:helix-turn-helix transcriptional regulator [Hyphococcus sp.]|uniref:helix-turn-helix transcriptional regulator n=1 Tax=Hyphococcus sp. TaxID=2038636 RepID=UPI003CCBA388
MLVERDSSLLILNDRLQAAERGRGGVVLVSGEAGIGKTSLLEAFMERAACECKFLWGACDALFTPRPLGPVHDFARALDEKVQALLLDPDATPKLFSAILETLENAEAPTVIVIEDVHWADHSTLDFLLYLGRRISFFPILLVLSYRSDEVAGTHPLRRVLGALPQSSVHRIELSPLTAKGVERLCTDGALDNDKIFEISGGNPFFVTEIIHAGGVEDIPVSIRDAVSSRLSRLSESEQSFLEKISVIPGAVHSKLLYALFGEDGETYAMACVGRKILMQNANGALKFRHELARLATLARITATEAKTYHRDVLEAYEDAGVDPGIDKIVHHAAAALDSGRVLATAPAAAAKAASVGAHREAAAHYQSALEFIDEAEPQLAATLYESWAYEAGLSERIDDDVIEARRHALTLWRALERPEKVGENLRWLSRLHWYRGESSKAQRYADEAVRVIEKAAPSSERAMAYSLRSQLHMLNDRMDEAVAWGEKALALADEFGNAEAKVHALNNIGTAKIFRGNIEGVAAMRESLRIARAQGFHEHAARVYTNLAEYAVEFRDFALAEDILAEGIAYDSRNDLLSWTHYLVGRQAQLRVEQGRLHDAATIADGVLQLPELTLLMKLPALTVLGKAKLRLGESGAGRLLAQALADATATDEAQYIVPIRLCLVEAAWLNNDAVAAHKELRRLFDLGVRGMHDWNVGETAVWAHRFGVDVPKDFISGAPAPHALEIDGRNAQAAAQWRKREAMYAAILSIVAAPEPEAEDLAQSIREARAIGARAIEEKARQIASEKGVSSKLPAKRRGPYKASRHHPLGLTAKEQEVLRLICSGENNISIAEKLSRSKKTIEHHASSIFRKMNVANRMEAMLRVQSEPWLLSKA